MLVAYRTVRVVPQARRAVVERLGATSAPCRSEGDYQPPLELVHVKERQLSFVANGSEW